MRNAILSFAVLGLTAVPAIAQDLTITSKAVHDGTPSTAVSYLSSDHVRMNTGDGNEVMFDLKSGQMTMIDHAKKTYSVMTKEDFDAAAAKIKEQMNSPEMQRAQEQMKNLPPEVRARMESMMGGMMQVDVQKTGTSRRIAGYNCDNWTVKIGTFSTTEECLTNELKFPMNAWNMYKNYADSLKSMMSAMGPMAKNMDSMIEQMKKLKGYPLAHDTKVNVMGRSSSTSSEVTSIKEGPIPASVWEVPAGYKKVDSPMAKMRK